MGALGSPTEAAHPGARPLTQLIRIGRKLAVLGVRDEAVTEQQAKWWHVVQPGSYSAPDLITRMTYGRSVCGLRVVTNGYASDFTPPPGVFCPACRERI